MPMGQAYGAGKGVTMAHCLLVNQGKGGSRRQGIGTSLLVNTVTVGFSEYLAILEIEVLRNFAIKLNEELLGILIS